MPTERIIYHVVPNASGDRWALTLEKSSFREEHPTREEALAAARQRADAQPPAQVKVHKADGSVEYERTYGDHGRSPG